MVAYAARTERSVWILAAMADRMFAEEVEINFHLAANSIELGPSFVDGLEFGFQFTKPFVYLGHFITGILIE